MLSPIPEALEALRAGRMIVLVDDEDRENEGDLVLAAEKTSPEAVNFMLRVARGYLCLSLTGEDCDRLDLHPQAAVNTSVRGTPFTISIDAHPRHGVSTGVSAFDRARSILLAINPTSRPDDFVRPGHINPLRARDGGVLVRTGQTEGSVDLCRLAGLHPSAVIIEIMREDGAMARRPDLEKLCAEHGLLMCSVAQLIEHRLRGERLVRRIAPVEGTPLRTEEGDFSLVSFESLVDPVPQLALTVGGVGGLDPSGQPRPIDEPVLVRMHQRNLLGDIFGEDSGAADGPTRRILHRSMRMIQREGRGALVYLRPEGVGDDLRDRLQTIRRTSGFGIDAPNLGAIARAAEGGAPLREYGIGVQILRELGVSRVRLITNHPRPLPGLEAFGLEVVEHVPVMGDDR